MFFIAVCMDSKQGIGKGGVIPWNNPEELAYFKNLTSKTVDPNKRNAVIMGRKTWLSLPEKYRPLPDRWNIVLTRSVGAPESPDYEGADVCNDFSFALEHVAKSADVERIFVIGGSEVYAEALRHPDLGMIFASILDDDYDCDTFFPELSDDFESIAKTPLASFTSSIIVRSDLLKED